jgi:hypothetical protein
MTVLSRLALTVSFSIVVALTLLSQVATNAQGPITPTPTVLEAMRAERGRTTLTSTPDPASPESCAFEQLSGSVDGRAVGRVQP